MLWDKKKHVIKIRGGQGQVNTEPLHGLLCHLIVQPVNAYVVWSMHLVDREGDEIFEIIDHQGRLDDKSGIPVGKDMAQRVTIKIFDVTANEDIKVVFKVKEM